MKFSSKFVCAFLVLSNIGGPLLAAYCPRCVKIESERAKEQAEHPQSVGYYDDKVNIHDKTKEDQTVGMLDNEDFVDRSQNLENAVGSDQLQNPGMGQEQKAAEKARARYKELTGENQAMIQGDRSMMKEGYDPNQGYGGFPNPNLNNDYPNQESNLRGETTQTQKPKVAP